MVERNRAFDGLRGIAVILTFLVHFCGSYLAAFRGANPNLVGLSGWHGYFDTTMYWLFRSHHGVYLFFLLSGFLIARVSLRQDFKYWRFVGNRLTRIYPAFLLALAICGVAGHLLRFPPPTWTDVAANLLFLNGMPSLGVPGMVFNNVTWSLFYEMTFYLVFPLILALARWLQVPLIGMIVLCGLSVSYLPGFFGLYTEFYIFLFAGAVVGCLSSDDLAAAAKHFSDAIIGGIYILVVSLMTAGFLNISQFVWIFTGLAVILLCRATAGTGLIVAALGWQPLAWLGRISYSFYLLHSVVLAFVFAGAGRLNGVFGLVLGAAILGAIGFIGALFVSALSYRFTEAFYFHRHAPVVIAHRAAK